MFPEFPGTTSFLPSPISLNTNPNRNMKQKISLNLGVILTCLSMIVPADACTGITLRSKDGAVIFGRTCEWGTFDLKSRLVVIPRDFEIKSDIGDGETGFGKRSMVPSVSMHLRRTFLWMA